jgi:hypothetical protein
MKGKGLKMKRNTHGISRAKSKGLGGKLFKRKRADGLARLILGARLAGSGLIHFWFVRVSGLATAQSQVQAASEVRQWGFGPRQSGGLMAADLP